MKKQKPYCGPDSWPEWARAIISRDPLFNEGCFNHDYDFTVMGHREADEKLYKYLVERIGSVWLSPYRRFKAWAFYKGVRGFGKGSYEAAQKKEKV